MRLIAWFVCLLTACAAEPLTIYVIDESPVDATAALVVAPSGESMLIDTGFARNLDRVLATLKLAGIRKLDYVIVTHYHHDHAEGFPPLAARFPIGTIVDHGEGAEAGHDDAWWKERRWETFVNQEVRPGMAKAADDFYAAHARARAGLRHIVPKPGEKLSFGAVEARILSSGGAVITSPLAGAGRTNTACAQTEVRAADDGEDQNSIGLLLTFGRFRFVHLGDLSWERLYALFCPRNLLGAVDAYLATHHASRFPKSPAYSDYFWRRSAPLEAEVLGLKPRAAILSAGYRAGRFGTNDGLRILRMVPEMDVWQTVWVTPGSVDKSDQKDYNSPEPFIANMTDRNDTLRYIKLQANADGSFAVTSSRNGFTKRYAARR
jgi:hypothetical protein